MHEYDIAFKLTLQQVDLAIRELTGTAIARWLNVELPESVIPGSTCLGRQRGESWSTSNCSRRTMRRWRYAGRSIACVCTASSGGFRSRLWCTLGECRRG